MFRLEKHRHQLIIEVKLPDAALAKYKEQKKADPTGAAVFTLETEEDLALAALVSEQKSFKASIIKKIASEKLVSLPFSVAQCRSRSLPSTNVSCTQDENCHQRSRLLHTRHQRSFS